MLTVGSLFSGCEGTSLGLTAAGIEHRLLWVCDKDKAAAKVLEARFPGVPNLGDVTKVDWRAIAVPDLLTGGFPCQDVSLAGRRAGLSADTRSGLWLVMAEAIRVLRPRWVLIENTRGLLSARADSDVEPCPWCLGDRGGPDQKPALRALGAVLGDLSDLGYVGRWVTVAASDVGAAHQRERVFVLAHRPGDAPPPGFGAATSGHDGLHGADPVLTLLPTPRSSDTGTPGRRASEGYRPPLSEVILLKTPTSQLAVNGGSQHPDKRREGGPVPTLADEIEHLLPTPAATRSGRQKSTSGGAAVRPSLDMIGALLPTPDATHGRKTTRTGPLLAGAVELLPTPRASDGTKGEPNQRGSSGDLMLPSAVQLGNWGRFAPAIARWEAVVGRLAPDPTEPGKTGPRLSPRFVEWMQGMPAGHVTDLVGRNDALRILGNAIVPQQLAYALRLLTAEVAR